MVDRYTPSAPGPMAPEVYRELERIGRSIGEIARLLEELEARLAALEAGP